MDEINVSTKFMRRLIAGAIEKTVSKKLGVKPSFQFNDPIKVTYDENGGAYLHLNLDVMMGKEELEGLLETLI